MNSSTFKRKFYLIDSSLVDVNEGGGSLQVLQVDVVDDPRVNDDVILKLYFIFGLFESMMGVQHIYAPSSRGSAK